MYKASAQQRKPPQNEKATQQWEKIFANNVSDKGLYPKCIKNPFNSIARQIAQLKMCRGNEQTFFFSPRRHSKDAPHHSS